LIRIKRWVVRRHMSELDGGGGVIHFLVVIERQGYRGGEIRWRWEGAAAFSY
jgi:hypothetical protein